MNLFKRTSTEKEERDKLRAAQHKARADLEDTFEHLFTMMDETLAELKGEPHLIEDKRKKAKARGNGRTEQS